MKMIILMDNTYIVAKTIEACNMIFLRERRYSITRGIIAGIFEVSDDSEEEIVSYNDFICYRVIKEGNFRR